MEPVVFLENARKSFLLLSILHVLRVLVYSFTRSSRLLNHVATVSGVLLNLAGVGNFATSASCIPGVFMELAVNSGSATVSLNGEDICVIKVTRALDLKSCFVESLRFSSLSSLSLLCHS